MHYVYVLSSIIHPETTYIGCTSDLEQRLAEHNRSTSPHISAHKPWQIEMYLAFKDKSKAMAFEKYLKSGSGRAFTNKHF